MRRNPAYQDDHKRCSAEPAQRERLEKKWLVSPLPDPAENVPTSEFVRWSIGVIRWCPPESLGSLFAWRPEARHELATVFDLRLPLEHQLALAGVLLKNEQTKFGNPPIKRPRKNKLLDYLRIIDAFVTELGSEPEILSALASALYDDKKKDKERARNAIIDDRKQAFYYLNSGYRDILRVMSGKGK